MSVNNITYILILKNRFANFYFLLPKAYEVCMLSDQLKPKPSGVNNIKTHVRAKPYPAFATEPILKNLTHHYPFEIQCKLTATQMSKQIYPKTV